MIKRHETFDCLVEQVAPESDVAEGDDIRLQLRISLDQKARIDNKCRVES